MNHRQRDREVHDPSEDLPCLALWLRISRSQCRWERL
jgi:hypothetical protein